ncbi:hypothetical protein C7475_1021015 [Chitinophaga sp. S165]|nr:hypothetical protein C7475_1021015 [Chitinophaga sp. S165]
MVSATTAIPSIVLYIKHLANGILYKTGVNIEYC